MRALVDKRDGNIWTFAGEYEKDGKPRRQRVTMTIASDAELAFLTEVSAEGGPWTPFLVGTYR